MNKVLNTSETPFGLAVKGLAFTRRVEHGFAPTLPPGIIFQQRALIAEGTRSYALRLRAGKLHGE